MGGFDPEILQDFLTESGELLDELEGDLVSLEDRADDIELINQVFRALHTIKGSASFLALTNLVAIAHAAETCLNAARNEQVRIDQHIMNLLLQAIDVLKIQFDEIREGSEDLTPAEPALVEELTAIGEGRAPAAVGAASAEAGSSGDAPTAPPTSGTGNGIERPLELDPSKADLLEHFADDLDDQLSKLRERIDSLADDAARAEAIPDIAEIGRDVTTTIDFFEIESMASLAATALEAAGKSDAIAEDAMGQLIPRLDAIMDLLNEQTQGLRRSTLVERDATTLIERVKAITAGQPLPEEAALPPGAGVTEAMAADGVKVDGTGEATNATGNNATATDPAPTGDAEPTEAASTSTPDAAQPKKSEAKKSAERSSAPEQTIRVEVSRLESLMNLVGELVLQKNRIGELAGRLGPIAAQTDSELAEQVELSKGMLSRVTSDIQVAVMRTRMQPLDKLFGKYPRLIRDLAQKTGKKIRLEIIGGETEVDKSVIEELGDPLVHLMRNSADHGLEPPEERTAAGKDETGTITLHASQQGNNVEILIVDDGRGLNRARIGSKAVEKGLVKESELESLTDDEVARMIFLPGFSTVDQVSDLSGRGVGMDVVRTNIENLNGVIDVHTEEGKGTTFTVSIPLTVAIMPAMMVRVADEQYAIPLGSIIEIVKPDDSQLGSIIESRVLRLRDRVLPILHAPEVFGLEQDAEGNPTEAPLAVIIEAADKRAALMVSGVIGQQEIVIKPLEGVGHTGPVSGATVRNDGGVSLIMDVTGLIRRAD